MSFSVACSPRPADPSLPLLPTTGPVDIYHPLSLRTPFLSLQTSPIAPQSTVHGIPLGIVLDACFVLASNRRGQLRALDPPHEPFTIEDPDVLLEKGGYIFVVLSDEGSWDSNYSLCPSFEEWDAPVVIPSRWEGPRLTPVASTSGISAPSDVSMAVRTEDRVCIISGAETGLQASHIIPKGEKEWFRDQYRTMLGYGARNLRDINSVHNEVALRADLNGQGLDHGHFVFAPYGKNTVAIFPCLTARDLAYQFHLKIVNIPSRIVPGFLFIRFAWAVFKFWTFDLAETADDIEVRLHAILKRKREDGDTLSDNDSGDDRAGDVKKTKKAKEDTGGGGNIRGRKREERGSGGGGGGRKDDGGKQHSQQNPDEALLAVYEAQDAALQSRHLTVGDEKVGRYPGFSKIKRLEMIYKRDHPEVSAVRDPRVWDGENIEPSKKSTQSFYKRDHPEVSAIGDPRLLQGNTNGLPWLRRAAV
ncbi:hypothetical protein B0H17DRAFT_1196776 [Mycena rosella]|uniref:HNH nuclease domain-containing protein n=1 Tax=Mycena rosella TaxID=1033263 RepID=A0AAD7DSH1_MYCRO|nr:hypothetical protein B0H17DRAFT_1196776 [Mycena rosella]